MDQVFGGGPMHEISGKKVEVKPATPRGSGPQGRGPQPPGPFLRPMPPTGLPSRFPGLQGQLGQQVGPACCGSLFVCMCTGPCCTGQSMSCCWSAALASVPGNDDDEGCMKHVLTLLLSI